MFQQEDVRFQYPENWKLTTEQTEDGWSVTVQSREGGAFLLLSVHGDRPEVERVLETAVAALREDYPDLETTAVREKIAGHTAQGRDIQFLSLDFVTTCWLRSWRDDERTFLVLCQASDLDADQAEPVLRAMRASMETF